ncbi:hypothetical protein BaRGS_00004319 [Batillaria attramentaria]|uniref:F5/8 type C domain-containing protein n=1 Tax=Batillaria attramentaria TaxID=370345 RepID=A0ABD0LZL5_9CAEN
MGLGMKSGAIPDEAITASSSYDQAQVGPENARSMPFAIAVVLAQACRPPVGSSISTTLAFSLPKMHNPPPFTVGLCYRCCYNGRFLERHEPRGPNFVTSTFRAFQNTTPNTLGPTFRSEDNAGNNRVRLRALARNGEGVEGKQASFHCFPAFEP